MALDDLFEFEEEIFGGGAQPTIRDTNLSPPSPAQSFTQTAPQTDTGVRAKEFVPFTTPDTDLLRRRMLEEQQQEFVPERSFGEKFVESFLRGNNLQGMDRAIAKATDKKDIAARKELLNIKAQYVDALRS